MSAMTLWAVLTGSALIIEMLTGTFYLMGVALGGAAGLLAAAVGAPVAAQVMVFAVLTAASLILAMRCKRPAGKPLQADVGQDVEVLKRNADGSFRVAYRGTEWDAVLEGPAPTVAPTHLTITRIAGSRLQCKAK